MGKTILPIDFPEHILGRPDKAFRVAINGRHVGFVYRVESDRWCVSYSSYAWDKYNHSYLQQQGILFPTFERALEVL